MAQFGWFMVSPWLTYHFFCWQCNVFWLDKVIQCDKYMLEVISQQLLACNHGGYVALPFLGEWYLWFMSPFWAHLFQRFLTGDMPKAVHSVNHKAIFLLKLPTNSHRLLPHPTWKWASWCEPHWKLMLGRWMAPLKRLTFVIFQEGIFSQCLSCW